MKTKSLLLLCFVVLLFIECKKKYPNDTDLHFSSPRKRLCHRDWIVKSYNNLTSYQFQFSPDFLPPHGKTYVGFGEDGTCKGGGLFWGGSGDNAFIFDFYHTWDFTDGENKIKVYNNADHYTIWTIDRLDHYNLTIHNDSIRYEFDSAKMF